MPVTIASHQPFAEPSFSQYFATTWEPTRSASQDLGGAAFSGSPVDDATGFAAVIGLPSGDAVSVVLDAEVEEVAAVAVALSFVVCSDSFATASSVLADPGDPSRPDVLRTWSSMRRYTSDETEPTIMRPLPFSTPS